MRPGVRKVSKKTTTERVSRRTGRSPASDLMRGSGVAASDRVGNARNESGAIIILALVYIVAVSLIVGALADWATNDLNNTTKFNDMPHCRRRQPRVNTAPKAGWGKQLAWETAGHLQPIPPLPNSLLTPIPWLLGATQSLTFLRQPLGPSRCTPA